MSSFSMMPLASMNDPDGESQESQQRRIDQSCERIEQMRRLLRRPTKDKNHHDDSESRRPDKDRPPDDS
jgi:hypothetical protein